MIITLTMHPCIDKSTTINRIVPEKKLRCTEVVNEPGGGGINVAKALRKLGADPLAIFPAGGHNGNMLMQLLKNEGVKFQSVPVEMETRESFIVLETETNKQFRFGTPGGNLGETNAQACLEAIRHAAKDSKYIVASGSLPPGVDDHFYAKVAAIAKEIGARFVLDTSGDALEHGANEGVYLLKPNLGELSRLIGVDEIDIDHVDDAALEIISRGNCEVVVASLGRKGAMIVSRDFQKLVCPPEVEKKSTVGAGDSMVAGMVWMLSQGKKLDEVVQFGVACGSAATMNSGTALFDRDDAFNLFKKIKED